jgi:hypothetical protein
VVIMHQGRAVCEGSPAALIESHVEPEAVELDCTAGEEARMFGGAAWPRLRSGHRLVVYAQTVREVVERIHAHDRGDRRALVIRDANLEDVFLATTGTQLEEHP